MTRPRVTLKLATSLDGRIATSSGESKWITGVEAREAVHRLRAAHDAVMVGIETALADDPDLTVRLADHQGRQPMRVVLDSRQRLPLGGRLAATARDVPVVVIAEGEPSEALTALGVVVRRAKTDGLRPAPKAVLGVLAKEGVGSVLIEGGGQVAASFLLAGLVDAVEWFRAPIVLGAEGRPAVGALALGALGDAPRFKRLAVETVGDDLWERYERA